MNDARYCEQIVRHHARTFALASLFLPREKRRGVYALYAFCRTVDDLVDSAVDKRQRDHARREIESLRTSTENVGAPFMPSEPRVERELVWTLHRFGIARSLIVDLLNGVESDLTGTNYATWADLERYCQGVASTVGEMCTSVFGCVGGDADALETRRRARTLGLAMQLTNVLRDVGEDASAGRCYLPEEDLDRFALSRSEVLNRGAHTNPAWPDFMNFEIARARTLYASAIPGISLLQPDAQRCAIACASGYAAILDAIRENDFDTITRRAIVGPAERARVLVRSWLRLTPELPASAHSSDENDAGYASHVAA